MCGRDRVSVVVPAMSCSRLEYLLSSLSKQTTKPSEVIVVFKGTDLERIDRICGRNMLKCTIIEQREGYFTHALNLGKEEATGDIIVFTDDDAIAPPHWIERYIKLHQTYGDGVACISSRDLYVDVKTMRTTSTPDDAIHVKLFRWLVRPWLERPHLLLKKYRFGVYVTKSYKVAHGPYIPGKLCYSLPFRGVNMSFKREALDEVEFPEHPLLKRAPGNEQYVGLQLILKGWGSIYTPNNPILHMHRSQSLSRRIDVNIHTELHIMRILFQKLLFSSEI
jgi:glycosyltransferase involved in cell wall biosynthesis